MPGSIELLPGAIVWASLDPARGREQSGRRPVLVVASRGYLDVVDTLAIVVPVTTVDRRWPNHVRMSQLERLSFAMTEQIRTVARSRLHGALGSATPDELVEVRRWLGDFLDTSPVARAFGRVAIDAPDDFDDALPGEELTARE